MKGSWTVNERPKHCHQNRVWETKEKISQYKSAQQSLPKLYFLCESGRFTNTESLRGGGWGAPEVTTSCVRKDKSTLMPTAHTRLLERSLAWVKKISTWMAKTMLDAKKRKCGSTKTPEVNTRTTSPWKYFRSVVLAFSPFLDLWFRTNIEAWI